MSLSRIIIYSFPSKVTSVPEYFPYNTLSPSLTVISTRVPLSLTFPGPTATIVPCCGFSCAVSGRMIPPVEVSSAAAA